MSSPFESIKQGLEEAIAHAKGDEHGVRVHRPRTVDVKAVRAALPAHLPVCVCYQGHSEEE